VKNFQIPSHYYNTITTTFYSPPLPPLPPPHHTTTTYTKMTSTTYTHKSKTAFLQEGIELTILELTPSQEDCAICTRPLYNGTCCTSEPGLRIIACGHILGHTCALRWLETANSCPFCRAKLFPTENVVKEDWAVRAARQLARVLEDPASREAEAYYEIYEAEMNGYLYESLEGEEMPARATGFW
jgi:hypothetical protein